MAKRRAATEIDGSSDESYNQDSTPAKRQRVEEDSESDASLVRVKNAKKKKVIQDYEDIDEAELDAQLSAGINLSRIGNDQDDAENEARILDAISRKEKKKGGIASMGVIESVEMHHFMCHPRLSFKFGPQINFIIGHNGSGKSAVLSALTIALGGKAISTGRGNGLKSFIREGQNTSEVTIGIKNQGDEAFKPDIYGKTIYVTRRFTKEGSSSYRIKSADNKTTVSTKRDELAAICDHMNIQVDNPMNILTQDSARQFLSASHPTDKYQFFLKGTQLSQLIEEYETCLENISKTSRTLQLKREEIPDLEKAFKEADARNDEANKAREKKTQLADFKRELAWAHVKVKENEMTKKMEEVAKEQRRIPRIEEELVKADAAVTAIGNKIVELTDEAAAVPKVEAIKAERDQLIDQIKRTKEDILECQANEREMNQHMKVLRDRMTQFDEDIRKINEKLEGQGSAQAEREQVQLKLQAAQTEFDAVVEELKMLPDRVRVLRGQLHQEETQGRQAQNDVARLQRDIEQTSANIEQCKNHSGDDLSIFCRNYSTVMNVIQKERWAGQIPVGPFGKFVSVRSQKWATVMRTQLGQAMSSFAVTDIRDRYKLKKILDQSGNSGNQIVISDVDLFDYSRGEPNENYLTVLRALDIKDEYVKRILINMRSIEKTLLVETRVEGDNLLQHLGGGGVAWSADLYMARRYPEGGGTSTPMNKLWQNDQRQHMFTGEDRSADIERWEDERRKADRQLQAARAITQECRQRYQVAKTELQRLEGQDRGLKQQEARLQKDLISLKEAAMEEAPIDIQPIEELKNEVRKEQKSIEEQFGDVVKRRLDLDAMNLPLIQKRNELDTKIKDWQTIDSANKERIGAAMQERIEATSRKVHWEGKLVTENEKVTALEEAVGILQTEFKDWSAKAEDKFPPQFENPRKPEIISRQVESVTKALQAHERRQGATPEEIAVERDNAKYALDHHLHQIDEVSKLNKALKSSLAVRMGKWFTFRQHMSIRCKHQFQHHLYTRGYYGKVIFDHEAGTLNLKVQTEDQASTQSKDKDPKSLSGGEKSYSTICLLLALWESIQCPLRCLDEFDVFMDSVNRRISMKMMIETANTSDKQYILITPQDMSHVALGPTVRVHRMNDPERNQNPLRFD